MRLAARELSPVNSALLHLVLNFGCEACAGCKAMLQVDVLHLQQVHLRGKLWISACQLAS